MVGVTTATIIIQDSLKRLYVFKEAGAELFSKKDEVLKKVGQDGAA